MKALKLGILAALVFAASGAHAKNYGTAGCGLGSVLLGKKGGFMQVFAATSNGLSGNQTFGITSGTSNCKPAGDAAAIMKQENFIVTNFSTISKEAAQGEGQALVGLSETLGCSAEHQALFNNTLRQNYGEVFAAPGAIAVLDAAKASLKRDASLANGCSLLNI